MNGDALGPWENTTLAGGRYQRLRTIGAGGMGYVYRAFDSRLKTDVVIKAPRPTLMPGSTETQLFEREIGVMIRLSFPHIVPVIDVGRHDGVAYAVMRFLPGGSLASRVPRNTDGRAAPMPWLSMKGWLPSIVKALDFIHRAKYVHRDVKPQNILFDAHDEPYLSDFGVAKFIGDVAGSTQRRPAHGGYALGTVDYMSPELLQGLPFDGRSDQYALAVSVYEVLAGRLPFDGPRAEEVIEGHLRRKPPNLSDLVGGLPAGLAEALDRGLSKRPEDRFATCTEFARALVAGAQSASSVTASPAKPALGPALSSAVGGDDRQTTRTPLAATVPPSMPPPPPRSASRRAPYLVAAVAVVLVLAGASLKMTLDASTDGESLGLDKLPRLISEWKQRAAEVEKSVVIDAGPLIKKPAYSDAADFERLLAAQAAEPLRSAEKSLDELTADLKAMAVEHGRRSRRLAELRQKGAPSNPDTQNFADEERRLAEQESQLVALANQLKSLQQTVHSPRGAYDAAAVAELAVLREMETVAAADRGVGVSAATVGRAVKLVEAGNPSLSFRALNVLASSSDPRGAEFAAARLELIPLDRQTKLVWSLLLSGQEKAVNAAHRQLERSKHVYADLDRAALRSLAASNPRIYRPLIPLLVQDCRNGDERLQMAHAQTDVLEEAWIEPLENECRDGLLQDRVGELVTEIIRRRRTAAYPLAERLLGRHREAKLDLAGDAVDELPSPGASLRGAVVEHWILRGTAAQRAWALAAYGRSDAPLAPDRLRAVLKQETVADASSLVNQLLPLAGDRFAELTEWMLTDVGNLPAEEIQFAAASPDVLRRPPARAALFQAAWRNERSGRPWVLRQILGEDFAAHFSAAESNRDRQLTFLAATTPVLNGKLVQPPGTTAAKTTYFLPVAAREIPALPAAVDPAEWAPDSQAARNLSELQAMVARAQASADEPYRETLESFGGYAGELQQLTAAAHAVATVYDLTIVKQLPGALREMKTTLVPSWDFRFPATLVESFRREDAKYQALSRSLSKRRTSLPWTAE